MITLVCADCGGGFSKLRRRGSLTHCPRCLNRSRVLAWKRSHPDRTRLHSGYSGTDEAKRRYAISDRGREIGRLKTRRWLAKNLEHARAQRRRLYDLNPAAHIQKVVNRIAHIRRASLKGMDCVAIAALHAEARRLTRETGIEHQVDHIYPLRGTSACGLHVSWNLQILTAAMNRAKGQRVVTIL